MKIKTALLLTSLTILVAHIKGNPQQLTVNDFKIQTKKISSPLGANTCYYLNKCFFKASPEKFRIMILFPYGTFLNSEAILEPEYFFHKPKGQTISRFEIHYEKKWYRVEINYGLIALYSQLTDEEKPKPIIRPINQNLIDALNIADRLWRTEQARTFTNTKLLFNLLDHEVITHIPGSDIFL